MAPWLSSLTPAAFGVTCVIYTWPNFLVWCTPWLYASSVKKKHMLYMEIACYLGEIMLSGAVLVGFLIGDLGHYLISLRSGLLDEIKKCKIICSMYVCMHVITAFWLSNIEVLCSSLDLQSLSEIKCVTKLFLSRHKRSKKNMYWKVIH